MMSRHSSRAVSSLRAQKVRALHRQGLGVVKIARRLRIDVGLANYYLGRMRLRKPHTQPAKIGVAVAMYAARKPWTEIDKLGLHRKTIRTAAMRAGMSRGHVRHERAIERRNSTRSRRKLRAVIWPILISSGRSRAWTVKAWRIIEQVIASVSQ